MDDLKRVAVTKEDGPKKCRNVTFALLARSKNKRTSLIS